MLAEGLTVSEMLHGLRLVTGVEQRSKIATTSPTRGLDPPLTTAPQQQFGSAIGTCLLAVERGHDRVVEQIRKQNTLCYRGVRRSRASVVPKASVANSVFAHGGFCVYTAARGLVNSPG